MPTKRLTIACDPDMHASIVRMIHEHPPDLCDGGMPIVRCVPRIGSLIEFDLIYPEPKPDIPALIKVWHADPSATNAKAVWQAIRDHGNHKGTPHAWYELGHTTYYAVGDTYSDHLEVRQSGI